MSGTSWLIDSKRIATKIKNASKSADPSRVKWISNPTKACPRCNHIIDNSDVVQEWPGLPQGVKFDPSDQELIWHLLAKAGKEDVKPHPFINEFIPTVDEDEGICYSHPQKLPGVKQDGSVAHFFHRTFRAYNTGTRKRRKIQKNGDDEQMGGQGGDVRWHKTGKTKPVVIDGVHIGCKKIMVLYSSMKKGEKPEKTNWVMHQYHLGTGEDEKDGEYVVSKVFYQQQQLKPCDNSKSEGHDVLPVTMVETLEGEASAAAPETETEPAVAVDHVPAPTLVASPQSYAYDEPQHPAQVKVDNESAAQNLEPEKLDGECNDNHLTTEEDSKWWEGESQFLLDSQQLAEGIALCDEFLQSQSSCGGGTDETKRIKPCLLSEYASTGGVEDLKRDLEECQTLGLNHLAVSDHQQLTTDIELLDTPPDMRLSQLEFGSQDSFFV